MNFFSSVSRITSFRGFCTFVPKSLKLNSTQKFSRGYEGISMFGELKNIVVTLQSIKNPNKIKQSQFQIEDYQKEGYDSIEKRNMYCKLYKSLADNLYYLVAIIETEQNYYYTDYIYEYYRWGGNQWIYQGKKENDNFSLDARKYKLLSQILYN